MNHITYITELDQFMDAWPFLLEGLSVLNDPSAGHCEVSAERFLKVLLRVALGNPAEGAVLLLSSKTGKPLAFVTLINNTAPFDVRSALCYAIYSNGKSPGAVRQLDEETKEWCRVNGYRKMFAASKRITGAAVRWFEKRRGFRKDCLVFVRDV